jgi:hypothetical protein
MSGYSSALWLALCAGLTALGLVLSVAIGRRRSVRAMLHGVAWSLIPIAAYMTGSTLMFWRIGLAIGKFASSFVFDPLRWAGIGVTGLIVVLLLLAGGRERRKAARAGRAERVASKRGREAVPAAAKGGTLTLSTGEAESGLPAVPGVGDAVPRARKPAPATKPAPARRGEAAAADNDMAEIEEILRKRGIQ